MTMVSVMLVFLRSLGSWSSYGKYSNGRATLKLWLKRRILYLVN